MNDEERRELIERCADVAEQFQDIIGWQRGESRNQLCWDIAQAIRKLAPPPDEGQ